MPRKRTLPSEEYYDENVSFLLQSHCTFMKKKFFRYMWIVVLAYSPFPLCVAEELPMQYRNIKLGDTSEKVLLLATNEFAKISSNTLTNTFDTLTIKAGDDRGMNNDSCPYAAPIELQKNCQLVRFIFSSESQGTRLASIFIEQSFSPAVSLNFLRDSLESRYGKPRLTFAEVAQSSINSGTKFVSLLWGGVKTPMGIYRPSAYPYQDREIIGGNYISVVIHYQQKFAVGYSMRIVDSTAMNEKDKTVTTELDRSKTTRQSQNEKSAKF